MIRKVLIANRGEIACRIARTCREMQIATVAVYSDADRDSAHVAAADEAVRLGPPPARESYLNIDAVVAAARQTGADAVHPGYGFLSENAAFAEACEAAGVIFVGPPGAVIRALGSKTGARAKMAAAGVPIVPGVTPGAQTDDAIAAAVREVGLPALLKAAGGGGGKGMRAVRTLETLADDIGAARREAERAFGNGALYVERLIERPRHVEVQILGDRHGTLVHVFDRDCTLQRRHQKVIEEAPAPALTPAVRARLAEAALAAGRAVNYVNAGTVEFLLEGDGDDARFYFLEINTRLQVEHPVTEAITGLDLVREQLQIAAGAPLSFRQADLTVRGHAMECRVYAEDSRRLLPQSGTLLRYVEPAGDGIRVDSGVRPGQVVTVHYDPLLAKLVVHAPTREAAIASLDTALRRFEILGLHHNIRFLLALLARPEFRDHRTHTRFIEEHLDELTGTEIPGDVAAAVAIAAAAAGGAAPRPATLDADDESRLAFDPWLTLGRLAW
jgi:acetyl-CoA carboxylase biotin carboxylase subunit